MPTQTFEFTTSTDRVVKGRLEMPSDALRGWAIFAHCFTCGANNIAGVRIARALAERGIGVLRFDFAGIGERELKDEGFAGNVGDVIAAAQAMARDGMPVSLLVGHSLGGAAALAAAGEIDTVKAIATLGAPFDVDYVLRHLDSSELDEIQRSGEVVTSLAGRPFRIGKAFIDELRSHDLGERIGRLRQALLVMHAPLDDTVAIDQATRIFVAARHPKSFVSLDDADHLLTRKVDTDYAADVITTWAERYLPVLEPAPEPRRDVEAEETGAGKFQVSVLAGGAHFFADEPVAVGGLGTGPSPYDLLSAAVAACTTMTLRLYAEHKGIEVGRIRTAVGHRKEAGLPQPDVFVRRISIDGSIAPEHYGKLLEIADKCPVHRTLAAGARFDTVIGEPPAAADPVEAHGEDMAKTVNLQPR
jgi:uncharacterized OsmC-like protein/fermentation-respiration switch protein FrsA (DUF1100 family)